NQKSVIAFLRRLGIVQLPDIGDKERAGEPSQNNAFAMIGIHAIEMKDDFLECRLSIHRLVRHAGHTQGEERRGGHHDIDDPTVHSLAEGIAQHREKLQHRYLRPRNRVSPRWPRKSFCRVTGSSTPGSAASTVSMNRSSNDCRFSSRCRTSSFLSRSQSSTGSMVCPSVSMISQ